MISYRLRMKYAAFERSFLLGNKNDLATVQLQKEVSWDGWEDLATNIKQLGGPMWVLGSLLKGLGS